MDNVILKTKHKSINFAHNSAFKLLKKSCTTKKCALEQYSASLRFDIKHGKESVTPWNLNKRK